MEWAMPRPSALRYFATYSAFESGEPDFTLHRSEFRVIRVNCCFRIGNVCRFSPHGSEFAARFSPHGSKFAARFIARGRSVPSLGRDPLRRG